MELIKARSQKSRASNTARLVSSGDPTLFPPGRLNCLSFHSTKVILVAYRYIFEDRVFQQYMVKPLVKPPIKLMVKPLIKLMIKLLMKLPIKASGQAAGQLYDQAPDQACD
jgi:hypothetical protein